MSRQISTVSMFGITIHNVSLQESVELIDDFLQDGEKHFIVTPNVDHVVKLQKDQEFLAVYERASLVLADGAPIVWTSHLLGSPLKERVTGADLILPVCELACKRGAGIFILGGMPGVAEKTIEKISRLYQGIQIAGCYSPPFGFEQDTWQNEKIVNLINESKADILFIALGAPKQEKWINRHLPQLDIKVAACIGAGIDFIAGVSKRAPKWTHEIGMEWLWRLACDPGRLWKRYLIQDFAFIGILLKEYLRRSK